jgi:hypothetical protein
LAISASVARSASDSRSRVGNWQNAILGDQVFVAEQQFLIHESGHEGQQTCPMGSIVHGGTSMMHPFAADYLPSAPAHRLTHTGM